MITLMAEAPLESPSGAGEMETAVNIQRFGLIALAVIVVVVLIYWFTKKK
jgi:hypothetical protein